MYNAFIFICRERKEFMSSGFSPTQPHLLFFFPELESDRTNQKYFVKFPTRQNPNGNWIDFSSCVYVNESVSVWQNFASAKKARREKYMLN